MNGFLKNELGFIRCNIHEKSVINEDNELTLGIMTEEEIEEYNREMISDGFLPNYGLDCYINNDFGAWLGYAKGMPDFEKNYMSLFSEGYDLVLVPNKSKHGNIVYQVFCKNYEDIYKIAIKKIEKKR